MEASGDDNKQEQRMEPINWAPEHSGALRENLARGLSFSESVKAINLKFSTAYSRNAAIGRAKRMGLTREDRPKSQLSAKPPSLQRIVEPRSTEHRMLAFHWPAPVFERVEPTKLRCVAIEPQHLSLIELEYGDCRYPYGGDEEGEAITFCGHHRRPGSSYCTPHFHLSRNPIVLPERATGTASLRVIEAA
jgi:GcrA cell cycle regulator